MTKSEDIDIDDDVRIIRPHLPAHVMTKLAAFIEIKAEGKGQFQSEALRNLNSIWAEETWALELRATAMVLSDLIDQGWTVLPLGNSIHLTPPGMRTENESFDASKERLRRSLQVGRDRQRAEPSVQKFLSRYSRPALNNRMQSCVPDLIDDGAELAALLEPVLQMPKKKADRALAKIIAPVVESCDPESRCDVTGIRLLDIWRYFRHTWSLEYRSIPGRQLPLLIRNAARPGRPVIGIALLASPILRTKARDEWIGWTPEAFLSRIESGKWQPKRALRALLARIDESIAEIRSDDLATPDELEMPAETLVFRLEQRSAGAQASREAQLRAQYDRQMQQTGRARSQSDPTRQSVENVDWRAASEDFLYVHKRAKVLAKLADAKRTLQGLNWNLTGHQLIEALKKTRDGKRTLNTALQEIRKAGLASQITDLSVCGAVPPYNILLGGKLVALAVVSEDVRTIWRARYEEQISVISSQMAGKPVMRPSNLKVVTTTSLYGVGSSQYNRLKLRASQHPSLKNDIVWEELAHTAGYGTVHLSNDTVQLIRLVSEERYKARRINNRFGEGSSPRLRQLREGLEALGIDSDEVLNHATPRIFYACRLVPNADKQLLGISDKKESGGTSLNKIAAAWRSRWLYSRIQNSEILGRLSRSGPDTVLKELHVSPD